MTDPKKKDRKVIPQIKHALFAGLPPMKTTKFL